jgi:hypothetical protein
MTKICGLCDEPKDLDDFHRHKKSADGRHPWCKECKNKRQRGHYLDNRAEILTTMRANRRGKYRRSDLKRNYGMSEQEYDARSEKQQGRCALCGRIPTGSLHVDHDHETGAVRGLLCSHCNTGLGLFRDNPDLLKKAIDYLAASRSEAAVEVNGRVDELRKVTSLENWRDH